MLTYITTSFISFCFSCALMDTNTHRHTDRHTHTHVHCYTIIVQEGGNRCPFRLRKRWHTHCACVQWGSLGINTFLQSQSQLCLSIRKHRKIPTSRTEAADAKIWRHDIWNFCGYKAWRRIQKTNIFFFSFFFLKHSSPQWVGVQGRMPFIQRCPWWLFSSGIVSLAISLISNMQSRPIVTNES